MFAKIQLFTKESRFSQKIQSCTTIQLFHKSPNFNKKQIFCHIQILTEKDFCKKTPVNGPVNGPAVELSEIHDWIHDWTLSGLKIHDHHGTS